MRGLKLVICGLTLFGATAVEAAECPGNPTALGTSRTIVVDPAEHPRLGTMQYRETLPLEDHEVVLTFDDGPLPPRSNRILEILASECVKATYFMVGRMARSFPDMVRRIHEAGHTIGTHSQSHPLSFHRMTVERAQQEINDGIASVTWALGDGTSPAPFFRIPGLLRADGVERYLASQHLMVWSADFPADDWTRISPAQVYTRALQRIEANRKGILLLHDIQPRTVEALPYLLRELKRRGYRIVHIVPARPDLPKTVTDPRQWIMHARMTWPQVPIYLEAEPELPAPSPSSFGVGSRFDSRSVTRAALPRPRTVLARRQIPLPPVSIWPRSLDEPPPAPSSSGRAVLPAPSPQSFGYPADAPSPPQPKASLNLVPPFNLVPETIGKEIDIRRLILESERASEDPAVTGSVPAPLLRDPAATGSVPAPLREPAPTAPTAQMPRGAFP